MRLLLAALFLAVLTPALARADCTDPVRPEGSILYNADFKTVQFCDGSAWWSMKGIQEILPSCAAGDGIVMSSAGSWACAPGEPP